MDSICKSLWRKITGKPYSGKLNVRFDEGKLEIGPSVTTIALYSTVICKRTFVGNKFIDENL